MTKFPTVTVRSISDVVTKGTTPTSLGRAFVANGIRFIKVETIAGNGTYLPDKVAYIDTFTHNLLKRSQLKQNDILFSIAGALGRTTIVEDSWLPANTNQAFAIIRPSKRNGIDSRYMLWALRSQAIGRHISEINVQAAQANLSLEQVRDFEIPLPSIETQKRISDALDDVEELVATLTRLIGKKRAIKQGVMQELLTGKTRLPGFSKPWKDAPLGEIARIKTGSRNNQDKNAMGSYPFFVRSATVERINLYSYDGEAILVPGEGGIGSIFHYINDKFEVHQRVYKISDFNSKVDGKFIYHYMRQFFGAHAMENSVKATVDSLRLPTFQQFTLTFPTEVAEQRAISDTLDHAEGEILLLEKRLKKASEVKQGMMQALLTGRTRLRPVEATA